MWSKKWYFKRNISCDVHLLNELLETDVPWDDAIVVSAGKLRKLWDSLSELRSSVCERRLERTVLRPGLLSVKTAQLAQFFPSGMTSHSKIAQFNWQFIALLRLPAYHFFCILCRYSILKPNHQDAFRSLLRTSQTIMIKQTAGARLVTM